MPTRLPSFIPGVLALLVLLTSGQVANADLVPPGSRRLSQYYSVANASAFPNYVLLSYPTHDARPLIVADGTRIQFDRILGAQIFATTKAGFDQAKVLAMKPEALRMYFASDRVRPLPLRIVEAARVAADDPLQSIEDVIVIDQLDPTGVVAHFDKVVYTTTDGAKHEQPWGTEGRPAYGQPVAPVAPVTPEVAPVTPEPTPDRSAPEPQRPAKASGGCAGGLGSTDLVWSALALLVLGRARRLRRST